MSTPAPSPRRSRRAARAVARQPANGPERTSASERGDRGTAERLGRGRQHGRWAAGPLAAASWIALATTCSVLALPKLASSAPAVAPTPSATRPEPSAADKETARSLVLLGDEKMAARDFQAALKAYRGADAIMGVPTTGIEVGRAEIALGLLAEATDTLLRVSRYPTAPDEPEAFAKARREAGKLAESLPARIPTLTIDVAGVAEGTEFQVTLDGKPVELATLGLPRKVNPGKHRIVAEAVGGARAETAIELPEREHRDVRLTLRLPSDSGGSTGGDDGGSDESGPAFADWDLICYVGAAVGGGGLLLGAITGGVSLSIASDVKDECAGDVCPTSVEDDADQSLTLGHVSTVGFVLAGAGAVTAAVAGVFWALEPESDPTGEAGRERTIRLEPVVGVGAVGLRGSF
jgi:hypothetical protein